jgi:hypothetical protein
MADVVVDTLPSSGFEYSVQETTEQMDAAVFYPCSSVFIGG